MTIQLDSSALIQCRRNSNRRTARFLSLFYGILKPRRRVDRRNSLALEPQYADIHGSGTLVVVLGIMLLCIADSYFTILLISHGSRELNPLLAWALEKDVMLFYSLKYVMTALCVYVVMMHKYFFIFGMRGYKILVGVLLIYSLLITYQLSMLFGIYQ